MLTTVTAYSVLNLVIVTCKLKCRNEVQQQRLCDYTVILWRILITFVAVEYLYVLNVRTACLHSCLIYPKWTEHAPYYIAICDLLDCTIFCALFHN